MKNGLSVLAPILCLIGAPAAHAEDFYAGKQIRVIVGGSSGGEYDTHARTLAPFIAKHIPGNPTIILSNMPAGTGIAAANYLANVAKRDGTELGSLVSATALNPILGDSAAKFTLSEFNWIGTPGNYGNNAHLIITRASLPWKTMAELRNLKTEAQFGNKGSPFLRITKEILGGKMNIIDSYRGQEVNLALERGEIDGMSSAYNNLQRQNPRWFSDKFINVLVQFGHDYRLPEFPDTPTARELATNADDRALIALTEVSLTIGYPIVAPPGVPADRVKILRDAFEAAVKSDEYRKMNSMAKLDYSPQGGAELAKEVAKAEKTPQHIIERYKLMASSVGQ